MPGQAPLARDELVLLVAGGVVWPATPWGQMWGRAEAPQAAREDCRVECWRSEVHSPSYESLKVSEWGVGIASQGTKVQVSSHMKGIVLGAPLNW